MDWKYSDSLFSTTHPIYIFVYNETMPTNVSHISNILVNYNLILIDSVNILESIYGNFFYI